jgi:pimeloyl-ACP methyl ester carboxylesterase
VFIGPAARPPKWADRFSDGLRLSPGIRLRLRRRSEERLGMSWDRLDLTLLGRNLALPLLVIHDREDREVPFADGEAIAASWPGARLQPTEGLGHRRVLEDETVIAEIVAFFGSHQFCQGCGKTRTAPHQSLCDSCEIEQMLFRPEDRPSQHVFQH